jgi:O-antigen/teichoic acid export membrane protein
MLVKRNLVANFVASIWVAALSLLLVPLYVRHIGIEAYALVGVYGMLQAMTSLLDMGFSTTMNREMARASADPGYANEARTLVRTLEVIYWMIALLIGIGVIVLAPLLARHWLTGVNLSAEEIEHALVLIGLIMLMQWPFSFYSGGLMGLQRQVLLSGVQMGVGTLRGVGAILILWLISPTIQAFFGWQIFISALSTCLVAFLLWRSLPPSREIPRFQRKQLSKVWRFAAGVTAISALGLVLLQADKIILSKILTLEKFGYYVLAGAVVAGLYMLVNSVYNAVFPRLTQLVASGDQADLARFYHQSAQVMSIALIPAVVMLALFSEQFLLVWTSNPATAANTYQIVTLLAIGTGLHGISHVPWALQLANGWTSLGFYKNLVSVIVLVPLIVIFALRFGAIGGAAMWVVVNLGEVLICQQIMHRRLLVGELHRWYLVDVGAPLLTSLMIAVPAAYLIRGYHSRWVLMLLLAVIFALAMAASVAVVPVTRSWVVAQLTRLRTASSARIGA